MRNNLMAVACFFVALLLTIIPMPEWAVWYRPEWVALLFIYWVLFMPGNMGIGCAWLLGLLLDGLHGSLMGEHALAMVVVAYVSLKFQYRIRVYPLWQQSLCVTLIILCYQMLILWVRMLTQQPGLSLHYWYASMVSVLCWPLLSVICNSFWHRIKTDM